MREFLSLLWLRAFALWNPCRRPDAPSSRSSVRGAASVEQGRLTRAAELWVSLDYCISNFFQRSKIKTQNFHFSSFFSVFLLIFFFQLLSLSSEDGPSAWCSFRLHSSVHQIRFTFIARTSSPLFFYTFFPRRAFALWLSFRWPGAGVLWRACVVAVPCRLLVGCYQESTWVFSFLFLSLGKLRDLFE